MAHHEKKYIPLEKIKKDETKIPEIFFLKGIKIIKIGEWTPGWQRANARSGTHALLLIASLVIMG